MSERNAFTAFSTAGTTHERRRRQVLAPVFVRGIFKHENTDRAVVLPRLDNKYIRATHLAFEKREVIGSRQRKDGYR